MFFLSSSVLYAFGMCIFVLCKTQLLEIINSFIWVCNMETFYSWNPVLRMCVCLALRQTLVLTSRVLHWLGIWKNTSVCYRQVHHCWCSKHEKARKQPALFSHQRLLKSSLSSGLQLYTRNRVSTSLYSTTKKYKNEKTWGCLWDVLTLLWRLMMAPLLNFYLCG